MTDPGESAQDGVENYKSSLDETTRERPTAASFSPKAVNFYLNDEKEYEIRNQVPTETI